MELELSNDVQAAILSFALSNSEGSCSVEFQKLLTDYSIDIHDAIIVLDDIQRKIESFLICLDDEL